MRYTQTQMKWKGSIPQISLTQKSLFWKEIEKKENRRWCLRYNTIKHGMSLDSQTRKHTSQWPPTTNHLIGTNITGLFTKSTPIFSLSNTDVEIAIRTFPFRFHNSTSFWWHWDFPSNINHLHSKFQFQNENFHSFRWSYF